MRHPNINPPRSIEAVIYACSQVRHAFKSEAWRVINTLQREQPGIFTNEVIEDHFIMRDGGNMSTLETLTYANAIHEAIGSNVTMKSLRCPNNGAYAIELHRFKRLPTFYLEVIVATQLKNLGYKFLVYSQFMRYSGLYGEHVYFSLFNTDDVIIANHDF